MRFPKNSVSFKTQQVFRFTLKTLKTHHTHISLVDFHARLGLNFDLVHVQGPQTRSTPKHLMLGPFENRNKQQHNKSQFVWSPFFERKTLSSTFEEEKKKKKTKIIQTEASTRTNDSWPEKKRKVSTVVSINLKVKCV